jgi:CubicO group peptidase (beta-lactamase class C family)
MDVGAAKALLEQGCSRFDVPGAQVGLLRGAERAVVCAGSVSLEGPHVVPATAFHAGSIAKSLTALTVLAAARRGQLGLDVPCAEQADGLWSDTPRQLMAQTTGRPNLLPDVGEDIDGFVARVAALPRVHEPGRFSYCNAGWSVLDVLLRRTCGATFEQLASAALGPDTIFGMPPGAAHGHGAAPAQPVHAVPSDFAHAASAAGARWWVTADQLLTYAQLHLQSGSGRFVAEDVLEQRRPAARVPGATMADSWGLGWALWHRGEHRAFGWAGYTGGHRAYLRCFPDQQAAVVVLANCAGPLFGPPGGSALFDAMLPHLLHMVGVPPLLEPPAEPAGRATADLAGRYGPVSLMADDPDTVLLDAAAFGAPGLVRYRRAGGERFVNEANVPGGIVIAVDTDRQGDLLYLGPFALRRS